MPKEIVLYHIGGEGDYGPAMQVIRCLRQHVRLVVFEARPDTSDAATSVTMQRNGITTTVINKGVDETSGRADFYVNKKPLSSSLLPLSLCASTEDPEYKDCHTWGENAELDYTITVDTISLDEVVAQGLAPAPDIISIDAQGAELRILRGATKCLEKALCIVSEVEFHEVYEGQGLFDDQMQLLSRMGYRLYNLMNVQKWHPGPSSGLGFLTVGEAVFMRFCSKAPKAGKRGFVNFEEVSDDQLIKLAGIAMSFDALSYCYVLAEELHRRAPEKLEALRADPRYRRVPSLRDVIVRDLPLYEKNVQHFRRLHRRT